MAEVDDWLEGLRELEDGKAKVYLGYRAGDLEAVEIHDTLSALGYEVADEKRAGESAEKALGESTSAILVLAKAADADWLEKRRQKLEERSAGDPDFHWVLCRCGGFEAPDLGPSELDLHGAAPGPHGSKLLDLLRSLRGGEDLPAKARELAPAIDREVRRSLETIREAAGRGEVRRLLGLWEEGGMAWESSPALGSAVVQALIDHGLYKDGLGILDELRERFPGALRPRQLEGLAQARMGNLGLARKILEELYEAGHRDVETVGLYARLHMDRYERRGRRKDLERSRDLYAQAFDTSPENLWVGVNAAAKSVLLGEREHAEKLARRVCGVVEDEREKGVGDYWLEATGAEVALILGDHERAARGYRQAVDAFPSVSDSHATTWLQARRLMVAMETPEEERGRIWRAFRHLGDAQPDPALSRPASRRLRVYALDPGLGRRLETAEINQITLEVPWEADARDGASTLGPGPVGEYLEVVDVDPGSGCCYPPIDLDRPHLLASDGLAPSESDPRFHQQMVYAVAMKVIGHFEHALGRKALWAPREAGSGENGDGFVRRLRIYPHALREANAYYSPRKKALLFGYFPARSTDTDFLPGGHVFTCLSHDVIAHEMSHALLDGLHPHFAESSNADALALHEAFADVVALFQHFSHPRVLRREIARTRGDLARQNMLGKLAQEFGRAIGHYGALRDALGTVDEETGEWRPAAPDPRALERAHEPHTRGAILVAAIFEAFLSIYRSRVGDLLRIATGGTGVSRDGELHPDLVDRLAEEASKTATHLVRIVIRALDYCPPVDVDFGDYLRALITADADLVADDVRGYRLAVIEAFHRRGIYPHDVRNLSVESLIWRPPRGQGIDLGLLFGEGKPSETLVAEWRSATDRRELFAKMRRDCAAVERWLDLHCTPLQAEELGLALARDAPRSLYRDGPRPEVKVHSVRLARRVGPAGDHLTDLVVEILQRRRGYLDPEEQGAVDARRTDLGKDRHGDFTFYGGSTLLIDPVARRVRYAITKHILSEGRLARQRRYLGGDAASHSLAAFGGPAFGADEPFALLHRPPLFRGG